MSASTSRAPADLVDRHRRACTHWTQAVYLVEERGAWSAPTPCSSWDARALLEHVIGFHDVLVLRPLGLKPPRPKAPPSRRWVVTEEALFAALAGEVPDHGPGTDTDTDTGDDTDTAAPDTAAPDTAAPDLPRLLPALTTDVLVHTWDLQRAVAIGEPLDPELCDLALEQLQHQTELWRTGLYGRPVDVPGSATSEERLVAMLGRDPGWKPPPA